MRKLLLRVFKKVNPELYLKLKYKKRFGKRLDLKNPKEFNEKILWLILYWQHPLMVRCSDKIEMRDYVKEQGLESCLPQLYGIYDCAADISWERLPAQFAIKCNHGCKYNVICHDKSSFDTEEAARRLDGFMKDDYGTHVYEPHYSHIKRKIFAEEYIKDGRDDLPVDYKLYCFNGEPRLFMCCLERKQEVIFEWYDLEWNPLDIGAVKSELKGMSLKPSSLPQMVEYAKKLSGSLPFPFVRIDFYDCDGQAILGEMSFTPLYGMAKYYNDKGNLWLGSLLKLPDKYLKNYQT